MSASKKPILGITLGDLAGVGPEVIQAALRSPRLRATCEYRLITGGGSLESALQQAGKPTPETAQAAIAALEEGVRLAQNGEIAGIVTGPIHKARSQAEGFSFPGQTEFFAERTGTKDFAMLLTGGKITVALVTAHVPLREVPDLLSVEEICRVGRLLVRFLQTRLQRPVNVAVAGLNPHAGESGAMGDEEIRLISPAVKLLREEWGGIATFSDPLSPDTLFNRSVAGEFDGILCMYHDQGLIPLKLHAFDEGVNVTLGLPFIRTSPDHGTAFEIAGKGIARPDSMIAAINLAADWVTQSTRKP